MNSEKNTLFVAFDLETTGFDRDKNAIIEIGIVRFSFNERGEFIKDRTYSQLIDPLHSIPPEVQVITGISDDMVKGKPLIGDVLSEIKEMFEGADYILGHNVNFDVSFLSKFVEFTAPAIDSQFFAETFLPGLTSYSLDVIPFETGIDRGAAHRALDDSIVSAEVFLLALRQFAALDESLKKNIISLYEKAGTPEAAVLKLALAISATDLFRPSVDNIHLATSELPDISSAIATQLGEHSRLVVGHTAIHNSFYSLAKGVEQYSYSATGPFLLSFTNRLQAHSLPGATYVGNPRRLICSVRLHEAHYKEILTKSEASLLVKLSVSETLNADFQFFPKLESVERHYLAQYVAYPETCLKHNCKYKERTELFNNPKALLTFSHEDFWNLPQELKQKSGLTAIIDYDEAFDALYANKEIKLNLNSVPDFLRTAPDMTESGESTKENKQLSLDLFNSNQSSYGQALAMAVEQAITKNDLFWALTMIDYKRYLEHESTLHITPAMQENNEFGRASDLADGVAESLEKILGLLDIARGAQTEAFALNLKELIAKWRAIVDPAGYAFILESMYERTQLTLKPNNQLIKKEFSLSLPEKVLLTSGTSAPSLAAHYKKNLGLEEWPEYIIDIPYAHQAQLHVVSSRQNSIDTALRIVTDNPAERVLVVAKNLKEARLTADHLSAQLPSRKVFAMDSTGSGSNKVLYKFKKEPAGILCIPPRGRILNSTWPSFDVAIVASIPFPAPEPHASFMESAFPRAMLAQKALLAKILTAGSKDLSIYLTDGRLTKSDYGKNFVRLAEDLCGCKHLVEEI
jgi:DNA polymerase-3 subunit epsilon